MKPGGQCFNHAQHVKQAKDCRAGFALPAAPLAKGEDWDAEIIGGFAFVKVQSVHGVPDPGGEAIGGRVRANGASAVRGVLGRWGRVCSWVHGLDSAGSKKPGTGPGSGLKGAGSVKP